MALLPWRGAGEGCSSTYPVECYWPGVTHVLTLAEERARAASAELRSSDREIAFLGSVLVPAD